MAALPQDPVLLLSYVNTKLRDECADFEDFCAQEEADGQKITAALAAIGYTYDQKTNRFI